MTLINQLCEDLQEMFKNQESEYNKVLVKEQYKTFPKGYFPKVIIQEIQNSEVVRRSTTKGERTTQLGYQITVYARDNEEFDNIDNVRNIISLIENYLKPPKYNMQRVGTSAYYPYMSDPTIMTGVLRYNCVYDYETNLIYKN